MAFRNTRSSSCCLGRSESGRLRLRMWARKPSKPISTRFWGPSFAPRTTLQATYANALEQHIGLLANGEQGRIGVAAIDLSTGEQISILGDQRFPMASTSKIAIAATFLEGVDKGKWTPRPDNSRS